MPWLEPDVNDHLRALAAAGEKAVVVFPVGFVSDHLEVIWDLDNEAKETAAELGLAFARAATAGTHPAFVASLRELLEERRAGGQPRLGTDCPAALLLRAAPAATARPRACLARDPVERRGHRVADGVGERAQRVVAGGGLRAG